MDSSGGDLGHAAKEIEAAVETKQTGDSPSPPNDIDDEKKVADVLSSSSSSDGVTPVEKLDSTIIKLDDVQAGDEAWAHLPEHEREIIKRQLEVPPVKVSYRTLYRYSTRNDMWLVVLSSICSILAGAAMPLMTVRSQNLFVRNDSIDMPCRLSLVA